MSEEKTITVKTAVPVLPCGHEASFEHEFVEGFGQVVNHCLQTGTPLIELGMQYVQEVFAYFYMQVPTFDEMQKIQLSHRFDDKTKEVN